MAGTSWHTFVPGARAKGSEVDANFDWIENDLLPMLGGTKVSNTYDLGSTSFPWRDAHVGRVLVGGGVNDFAFSTTGLNIYVASTSALDIRKTGGTTHVLFPVGTVSQPGIGSQGDVSTGLYFPTVGSVALAVSGAAAFTVHSNGAVVFDKRPYFHVIPTGFNFTISSQTVTGFTEIFDVGGNFSTGVFNTPVAGIYRLNVHYKVSINTTTSRMTTYLVCASSATTSHYALVLYPTVITGAAFVVNYNLDTTLLLSKDTRVYTHMIEHGAFATGSVLQNSYVSEGATTTGVGSWFEGYLL